MAANLTLPNPPLTLEGAILPGWMPREFAIHYLQNECYFDSPLTAEQAEGIWQRYKAAVDNLPERPALAPQRLPLTAAENREAATYVNTLRARGATNVLEAIKVNVMECVAVSYTHLDVYKRQNEWLTCAGASARTVSFQ